MTRFWPASLFSLFDPQAYYGGHFIEASFGMVFQVCLWERRKLQLVAACASKPIVARVLLYEVLLRSRFTTEIRITVLQKRSLQIYKAQHCAMTVITFLRLQLLLAWGFKISGKKENPANLPKKSAGNQTKPAKTLENLPQIEKPARNLRNPAETLQKPTRKPWKSAETLKTPSKMLGNPAETLRKPCGNPRKLAGNLRKPSGNPSETLRKPFENPAETQGNPYSPFGN